MSIFKPLEGLLRARLLRAGSEHRVDPDLLPELVEDVHATERPAVADTHVAGTGCGSHRRLVASDHAQDAGGEASQLIRVEMIGTTEVVDHLRDRAATLGVPDVLGELVVADLAAVGVATLRDPQVHAYQLPA